MQEDKVAPPQTPPKKKRIRVPNAVADQVLKEFRHRCAICGEAYHQLHHIDDDPSNNDPSNLIPLCPNHHLRDMHDPTAPIDPQKMRLFRRHKDPFILDPRFQPVWQRLKFLRQSPGTRAYGWRYSCDDLLSFIRAFEMGDY
jgi:hypothetical protein